MIRKEKLQHILLFLRKLCGRILQIVLSLSVLLIAGVLPLYFENGFTTIGTDKHSFFRFVGGTTMYMSIVLLLLIGAVNLILFYGLKEKEQANRWWEMEIRLSLTDKFLLLYAAAVFLSFLFSDYKKEALWGTSGWFMGMLPQFIFLGYYVLLSRVWKRVNWIFYIFAAASSITFLMGILNRFGIWPIDMRSANPAFISTIGNMNWFCGYWSACIFVGVTAFWLIKKEWFEKTKNPSLCYWCSLVLITVYTGIGLLIGLIQGSDSGYVALLAGMLLLLFLSAREAGKMIRFWEIGLILCLLSQGLRVINALFPERLNMSGGILQVLMGGNLTLFLGAVCVIVIVLLKMGKRKDRYPARAAAVTVWIVLGTVGAALTGFIVLIVVNTLNPGSIGRLSSLGAFTFDGYWGSMRGSTWVSGLWAFWDQNWMHKLIGIGPDCMSAYIYSGANTALEEYTDWWMAEARLTNAHGEWITLLLNTGIMGLTGFAGAVISGIVRFVKNRNVHWFVAAAAVCLLSYTANNIFSFQQTNNGAAIFLIWGVAEGILREKEDRT